MVVLAQSLRSGRVQAEHRGHAVHLSSRGTVLGSWGDPEAPTYWRSSAKPLQALLYVRSGAWKESGLGTPALALACSSHSSNPVHVALARRMLTAADATPDDLHCGTHAPIGRGAGREPEEGWSVLHNNCSGKHAAMLASCRRMDWPIAGYQHPDHPLQQAIRAVVENAVGHSVEVGVDGCSVPTFWAPLFDLAKAFTWLPTDPDGQVVLDAMAAHPDLVAGPDRTCTLLIQTTRGRVIGKVGAEGVYAALDRETGEALAVKILDGSRRAAEAVAVQMAIRAGWLDGADITRLEPHRRPPVKTNDGAVIGHLEPLLPEP